MYHERTLFINAIIIITIVIGICCCFSFSSIVFLPALSLYLYLRFLTLAPVQLRQPHHSPRRLPASQNHQFPPKIFATTCTRLPTARQPNFLVQYRNVTQPKIHLQTWYQLHLFQWRHHIWVVSRVREKCSTTLWWKKGVRKRRKRLWMWWYLSETKRNAEK